MCTALLYRDANGNAYAGRTLELPMEMPYQIAYLPAGQGYESTVQGSAPLQYKTVYPVLAVTVPFAPDDLKIVEGLNSEGLTFSALSYPGAAGTQAAFEKTKAALSAVDLGSWTLGQFATVADVKEALANQPVLLAPLAILGGAMTPFHYVLHDRTGASIVVEFSGGAQSVYDNPVGVMTNGPAFSWHLTNLNNYTFLSNVDRSESQFGALQVAQPDSGIATEGLPASNTSVGRFVRAAYYAQFADKVSAPNDAIMTLAHVMNNFDRPKGITVDVRGGSGGIEAGGGAASAGLAASEYTSWTALTDLGRKKLLLRTYAGINYTAFDLGSLSAAGGVRVMPLTVLDRMAEDGSAQLLEAESAPSN
ncbi:hydrolase [Methyloceanibacter stevinii]|uniref:Hydrolase n=1 Tax=Methyloceanibacter stevinii TaxID=1774970 RepID=A0A1E3VIZ6_9HYPH|nr:linear amide C-N hydrolase [Methyloceanibacter stevinii]ODR93483.1 hydrolase [Methyloceanibacter stevinii]